MSHLTYAEAGVVGLLQGITELFPVSSLGHAVLIPAIVGGQWAQDLNVSRAESPYLAYIVGLHVATALAMIAFFWRDWLRIIGAFFASLWHVIAPEPGTRRFEPQGTDQILAWMIIIATIPVGIAGLLLEHTFRTVFSKPILTSSFLFVNGLILLAGEARRRRGAAAESAQVAADQQLVAQRQTASVAAGGPGAIAGGRHSSGQRALKQEQAGLAVAADRRLTGLGFVSAFFLGAAQILALLPGISRDGTVMVGGMFRGLTRQDAARFSFLLSAPVIFAAGLLKIKDLTGPLGAGIRGQVLFGSLLSFIGAYLALRFLVSYLSKSSRTLTPFAIYCLVAGAGAFVFLNIR
ncbi:MAG TPA: undecaprenyl-diphosphate phosphatase [Streptosporangiaceae bacterium]|jgi:undecaprenyl-diphosphatase|nr:undecaprenyl-diphosphate phosphatase [Streptosporangiaceae bacterium]